MESTYTYCTLPYSPSSYSPLPHIPYLSSLCVRETGPWAHKCNSLALSLSQVSKVASIGWFRFSTGYIIYCLVYEAGYKKVTLDSCQSSLKRRSCQSPLKRHSCQGLAMAFIGGTRGLSGATRPFPAAAPSSLLFSFLPP